MKNLTELRKIISESLETKALQSSSLWDELFELAAFSNPKPTTSIDFLIVLSSNTTQLRKIAKVTDNIDLDADYDRVRLAINTALEITALKLSQTKEMLTWDDIIKHGPTIIYIGMQIQIDDLLMSFQGSQDTPPLHCDYPISKLKLFSLDPTSQISSKSQFVCIAQNVFLANKTIGWITHAYHFLRISRQIAKITAQGMLPSNINHYAFLVDRSFQGPGSLENIIGEINRIPEYIKKGDLMNDLYAPIKVKE